MLTHFALMAALALTPPAMSFDPTMTTTVTDQYPCNVRPHHRRIVHSHPHPMVHHVPVHPSAVTWFRKARARPRPQPLCSRAEVFLGGGTPDYVDLTQPFVPGLVYDVPDVAIDYPYVETETDYASYSFYYFGPIFFPDFGIPYGIPYGYCCCPRPVVSAAPEPDIWALMLAGLSVVGLAMRRRRRA